MLRPEPLVDVTSTLELRAVVGRARSHLLEVLAARRRTLDGIRTWHGPHRDRYEQDVHTLLASGRALTDRLDGLLRELDEEAAAARSSAAGDAS